VTLPPFQRLLDCYGRDVHRFLAASVGFVDADDVYQETWLAALRSYPRLNDASNLRGWIFTVAHRKAIDHSRSRRRQPIALAEVPEPHGAGAQASAPGPPPGATAADRDEDLWRRVGELPTKQRISVALRYVIDASYADIAAMMGTSEEAARRSVHEGLKRLRMESEDEG
jgi:RNA polymerase sigma factor (sigma-70 family)